MSEMVVLLSDEQQKALQIEIHELLETEINQFRAKLGIHGKYIKKNQLCSYLGLSNNTVDKLLTEGMPRINVQGTILYDKTAVDKWLKNYC